MRGQKKGYIKAEKYALLGTKNTQKINESLIFRLCSHVGLFGHIFGRLKVQILLKNGRKLSRVFTRGKFLMVKNSICILVIFKKREVKSR